MRHNLFILGGTWDPQNMQLQGWGTRVPAAEYFKGNREQSNLYIYIYIYSVDNGVRRRYPNRLYDYRLSKLRYICSITDIEPPLLIYQTIIHTHTHTHTHTQAHTCEKRENICIFSKIFSQVGWTCWILRLHLCRGIRALNECPKYDIKNSDGEAPALELWGMWSTSSLPSLTGPLWLGVVAPDRVLYMGQIEMFDI